MSAPRATPVLADRLGYVRLKSAAQRLADAANVAYWVEPGDVLHHHGVALEALADAARHLGFRLEPVVADAVEVAA